MAIQFNGSSYYQRPESILGTDPVGPVSFSVWAYRERTGSLETVFSILCDTVGYRGIYLYFGSASNCQLVGASVISNPYSNGSGFGVGWHHLAGYVLANVDVRLWVDGVDQGASGDSGSTYYTEENWYVTTLGALNTAANQLQGSVSRWAIWEDYAITQANVDALYAGQHPYRIGRGFLTSYYPLHGTTPLIRTRDMVGGLHLDSVTGTPTKTSSTHPRRGGGA